MGQYLGDYRRDALIDFKWSSYNSLGASVARSSQGTITVFRDNSSSASTRVGITDTNAFASIVGVHHCRISTGSTTNFFVPGSSYQVVTSGESIDGQFVNAVLAEFSIEKEFSGEIRQSVLQSSATTTLTLDTNASAVTDFYTGGVVSIIAGTGALQQRGIAGYAGATKVVTLDRALYTNAASGDTVLVYGGSLPTTLSETTAAIDSLDYATTSELNSGVTVTSSTVTLNANMVQINATTLTGDGSTTSWGPA